ncbi:MAG: hypothetical protein R3F07_08625 [Opitutaceae bacterium]
MIQPAATHPMTLLFPPPAPRLQAFGHQAGERPAESLAAPAGRFEEIVRHHGMVTAAEREFSRLLPRMEAVLAPIG